MDELDLGATIRGFSPGQRVFQRYTLRKILGRGGMGVVWLASDEKLEREVALKFLPEIIKGDRGAMQELKSETRRALALTHSNIVRIHDFVEDATTAAIAMEYVPGDTLANRRTDQPKLAFEVAELGRWVRQLCDAIAYAHEKARVVHRDLKPANLMLDVHGDLKVADFGIARSLSDSVSRISAQAGTSGTPPYMSPQQMMGESPSLADDIYAIGATLYELLTGKPPFFSGNLIAQVQAKVPPTLAQRRAELQTGAGDIPAVWEEVVAACLAKEAAERPASAREIAQRLGLAPIGATQVPFAGTTAKPAPAVVERRPAAAIPAPVRPPPNRQGLVVGTAVAVLALAAAGYWYFGVVRPRAEESARRQQEERAAREREAGEQQLRLQAAREGEEWRARLATGTVPASMVESLAQETTPRGEAARAYLDARQREQEGRELAQWREISGHVERIVPGSARADFEDVDARVRSYLASGPERHRSELEPVWSRRAAAWRAHEAANAPGTLAVETEPAGATVILYPRNERRTSPALFRDVKPGEVTFRIEKEGFESQDIPFRIEPGVENRPPLVRLTSLFGSVVASSDPAGVRVVVEGLGRRVEGTTPFSVPALLPGAYRVSFERSGWQPQVKQVTVERSRDASVHADLRGATLKLYIEPRGALLKVDGKEVGRSPMELTELEPRSYRVEATAEGYEPAEATINATGTLTWKSNLKERADYRMLKALAGHTWRLAKPWGWAEFSFDLQGRISGSHKIPLAAVMVDTGTVTKVSPDARSLTASFVPSQPHAFYTGDVEMTLLDEYTLDVQWIYFMGGKRQIYQYRRTDAPAGGKAKR